MNRFCIETVKATNYTIKLIEYITENTQEYVLRRYKRKFQFNKNFNAI